MDILSLFFCFETLVEATTIRHLSIIAETILSMSGRITMPGISRWAWHGRELSDCSEIFRHCFDVD